MSKLLPTEQGRRIAAQFPRMKKRAFFNSASLGPWPKSAHAALKKHISLWDKTIDATTEVFDAWREIKSELGRMINAPPEQIGFAFNTSHGISIAAGGVKLAAGDEIILSEVEFPANTYPWTNLRHKGVIVNFIPAPNRCFDLDIFRRSITPRTRLLAISFVQYFNGFRNDLEELGKICREHGLFFMVDGIQGVGTVPLDVQKCQIDFLACGAQKWLLSPVGSGFFYIAPHTRPEVEANFAGWFGIDWKADWTYLLRHDLLPEKTADRFNLSAVPYLQILAMRNSIKLVNSLGVENIHQHNLALLDQLIDYLHDHKYYRIASDLSPAHRSSILSIACPEALRLQKYLQERNIITSFREDLLRISAHFFNTPSHMQNLINSLEMFFKRIAAR